MKRLDAQGIFRRTDVEGSKARVRSKISRRTGQMWYLGTTYEVMATVKHLIVDKYRNKKTNDEGEGIR